ncbi:lipoprotein LpqH [Candidatus Mycobacterium wuenschmannii]|uniref:Lipoprotein LpqH n=1 Tax=Candidatus Mycobacterium wuenschmannii TaxID=3027808 RepID=A0ABY8W190_9MYCO|nr:lipoprotein LpqH [Candidatus Mycobacterium wuenschmannii]WIM89644.1 lipoprotein LpqH [Candidatus Mycobacterium wuenschmannii]
MRRRLGTAAVAAAVLAAACAGCFGQDSKATQKTAHITVDNDSRTSHAVTCNQVNWLLTANISVAPANVKVLLKLDSDQPKVESVHFDNFVGFSGVSNSGAGDAKIRVAHDTYTITGTASGSRLNDPRVSIDEPFTIEVGC